MAGKGSSRRGEKEEEQRQRTGRQGQEEEEACLRGILAELCLSNIRPEGGGRAPGGQLGTGLDCKYCGKIVRCTEGKFAFLIKKNVYYIKMYK